MHRAGKTGILCNYAVPDYPQNGLLSGARVGLRAGFADGGFSGLRAELG
jgi:hypothetical protein